MPQGIQDCLFIREPHPIAAIQDITRVVTVAAAVMDGGGPRFVEGVSRAAFACLAMVES